MLGITRYNASFFHSGSLKAMFTLQHNHPLINRTTFALPATAAQIGWLLVYGAAMQCLAWGLIAYCIPLLSLSVTGLLLLTEPVAALFIDFAFLGKPISALQWLGAAITLLAIYLGSLKTEKAA